MAPRVEKGSLLVQKAAHGGKPTLVVKPIAVLLIRSPEPAGPLAESVTTGGKAPQMSNAPPFGSGMHCSEGHCEPVVHGRPPPVSSCAVSRLTGRPVSGLQP